MLLKMQPVSRKEILKNILKKHRTTCFSGPVINEYSSVRRREESLMEKIKIVKCYHPQSIGDERWNEHFYIGTKLLRFTYSRKIFLARGVKIPAPGTHLQWLNICIVTQKWNPIPWTYEKFSKSLIFIFQKTRKQSAQRLRDWKWWKHER